MTQPTSPSVDAVEQARVAGVNKYLNHEAFSAAWHAYQHTPIDLVADSDDERCRCVHNAIAAYAALSAPRVEPVARDPKLAALRPDLSAPRCSSVDAEKLSLEYYSKCSQTWLAQQCVKLEMALEGRNLEIDDLKHDLERHIKIASQEMTAPRVEPVANEPFAWVVLSEETGNTRLWTRNGDIAKAFAAKHLLECIALYTAPPSQPDTGVPVAAIACRDCGSSIDIKHILSHPRSCIDCCPEFGDPRGSALYAAQPDTGVRVALETAVGHLEHMSAWISNYYDNRTTRYSFESLGEDMPNIRKALIGSQK